MNLNNLKILIIIAFLALPGCASGRKPSNSNEASRSANLTRLNDDNVRVGLMFTSVTGFEEGILFDRERDEMTETVVRLYCGNMVPEHVSVYQYWQDANSDRLISRPVFESKDDPFVFELSGDATRMEVVYNDGNGIVKRTFAIDDGELTLNPVEVAANFRH